MTTAIKLGELKAGALFAQVTRFEPTPGWPEGKDGDPGVVAETGPVHRLGEVGEHAALAYHAEGGAAVVFNLETRVVAQGEG